MFSDESMFKCIRLASTKVHQPLKSGQYDPHYTVKTVKHPAQVMVWGCFTGANGRGGLYFLPKGKMMNGATYKTVRGPFAFIHDKLLCHPLPPGQHPLSQDKSGHCFAQRLSFWGHWLARKQSWPQSNWKLLEFDEGQAQREEYNQRAPAHWRDQKAVSNEYLRNLSDSMPKRIKTVIKNKGEMTNY